MKFVSAIRATRAPFTVLAVCCVLAATAMPAAAGDRPDAPVKWKTYPVIGSTVSELRAKMKVNGPGGFYGFTKPHYGEGANCHDLVVKITLPVWTNRQETSPGLQRRWDRMLRALTRHELNHARHFSNASAEMRKKGCANADRIKAKWQAVTDFYDRITFHGAIEGAFLF